MASRPRISIDLPEQDREELKRIAKQSRISATRLAAIAVADMLQKARSGESLIIPVAKDA